MKTLKHLLFIFLIFLFSAIMQGCFKKDVMVDTADDVEEVVITDVNGEKVLVTKEMIYQATSKESGRGITLTAGYSEYRLSSYNLNTGELISRIDLGERDDNYHYFLGSAGGKLWYVSSDKDIGFHGRDPKTLEITVKQDDLFSANPDLKGNLPYPQWYEYRKYYGYDYSNGKIMLSDNSGFVYYLDPVSIKTERTDKSIENFDYNESAKSTSISYNSEIYLNLNGKPRKVMVVQSKEYPELSFLDGYYVNSTNRLTLMEMNPEYFAPIYKVIEENSLIIDSLSKIYEDIKDSEEPNDMMNKRIIESKLESAKRNIKYKQDEINRKSKSDNQIITKDNGVLIMHKSNASDTSKLIVSKIVFDKNLKPEKKWDTYIPDIFYEPSKVIDKSGFEYVFSKGSPNLSTIRIIYGDGKAVFIIMLRAVCINVDDGKILWSIEL